MLCTSLDVGGELVHIGGGKLAGRNLVLEENVESTKGSTPSLRKTEERPDKAHETGTGPKETGLGTQVPAGGVEESWVEHVGQDEGDVVEVSREHDCLGAETSGTNLGDDTETD